ncbi:DUF488 family protein [Streptomyces globisporus]|uniref:DUF488 family protein n=1 Tax=Streptomyces globisporus TaxID=1908 RepID=UPI0037C6A1B5
MKIYTIGFTKKPAKKFFSTLLAAGVENLIDIRLNNVSQLSGFAKRDDLAYFLDEICGMPYVHRTDLAPTQSMLEDYKKKRTDWAAYEARFLELMEQRDISHALPQELVSNSVLLCSEDKPHRCHRRLVAEYLALRWESVTVEHLV